jgi:hypothetical protein
VVLDLLELALHDMFETDEVGDDDVGGASLEE